MRSSMVGRGRRTGSGSQPRNITKARSTSRRPCPPTVERLTWYSSWIWFMASATRKGACSGVPLNCFPLNARPRSQRASLAAVQSSCVTEGGCALVCMSVVEGAPRSSDNPPRSPRAPSSADDRPFAASSATLRRLASPRRAWMRGTPVPVTSSSLSSSRSATCCIPNAISSAACAGVALSSRCSRAGKRVCELRNSSSSHCRPSSAAAAVIPAAGNSFSVARARATAASACTTSSALLPMPPMASSAASTATARHVRAIRS
mmetsp:Transcript_26004/g.57568  ORF Transcript_26004/g.57568 Transcript_26004/m.57568 type:complete len:262 (-) Transcript_26004:682-1467(-)